MNKKDKISFCGKRRSIILARAFSLAALITMTTIITMKPDIFGTASAQDLNPPTTGRTSPNVTSTFGPNMPVGASGSGIAGNGTPGIISNSTVGGGNVSK